VVDSSGMLNIIAVLKPNEKASLKIVRQEKIINIDVMVGKRPKPATNPR
jgi:serine protease DegQ